MIRELHGIESDNLLGFLALLGTLRALDAARPAWRVRLSFTGAQFRPVLRLVADVGDAELARAVDEGCRFYANWFSFEHDDLTFAPEEARVMLENARRTSAISASIASAMCSDAAYRPEAMRIEATPFCAMFGQGHQSFLKRLRTVSHGTTPRVLQRKKTKVDLNDPNYIARALFSPWTRSDATESFRWDHEEDRRYALRATDPSSDAATTEHGANRLAVLGLLSFQTAPTVRPRILKVSLSVRGVSRGKDRRPRITWPIWSGWASLEAIHAMLDLPELSKEVPSFEVLERHEIVFLRRTSRYSVGKYFNFSRAKAITRASCA